MLSQGGVTALFEASSNSHVDLVDALLAAKADKEAKDQVGG